VVSKKLNNLGSGRSRLVMLQLEVGGSLELGSLTLDSPPYQGSAQTSGPQVLLLPLFLKPFPSLGLSSLALPSLSATPGRAAAPFVTSSPSPLPATSIHQVWPPLLFHSAVRDGAPLTLTKLFVFGSESSYDILPTNFDFVCKNYRVYIWTPMSYAGSAPASHLDLESTE
jgi:hypothetical protein